MPEAVLCREGAVVGALAIAVHRQDNTIMVEFSHPLVRFGGTNSLWIKYDRDISMTPAHAINFMIGIILSEHLAWSSGLYDKVVFDELTESEAVAIQRHIDVNHKTDPYGFVVDSKPMTVMCNKVVTDSMVTTHHGGVVLAGNGVGKDGLVCVSLASEISGNVVAFTVGDQYLTIPPRNDGLWKERQAAMSKVYDILGIRNCSIMTNYASEHAFKIIPWSLFAVPLAYAYGASTILSGTEIIYSKTNDDNLLYRPNFSLFHLGCASSAIPGLTFSTPNHALSPVGIQRLLIERYPMIAALQRSCMRGMPWCYACSKCYDVYVLTKASGNDPMAVGIKKKPKICKIGHPTSYDTHMHAMNLINNKPVPQWVTGANESVFKLLWRGEEVRAILADTGFEFYSGPTTPDSNGYGCRVDRWEEWFSKAIFPTIRR